ncbi:coiled-coil domain-containing protein 14 isoform X2 [Clupea harengus]|uniref:Coiled-coil domain-containing protein 14 isoform X2 n=1 Tax=Clupea harengus TaxID=7950 RepID=A0A6P8ES40_CLUHA|nr:coiled-coil domain-containing protein 14 isoform X2 [Clupea harengus]
MTARQGLPKHKVISSGRLTSSSRAQPVKKKLPSRPTLATEPHYSLYSTDSEDQVTTIHKGLDRCAALLNGILQAEQEESKPSKAKGTKSVPSKPKPKPVTGKRETDRKKPVRKTSCASVSAPVQKTISSSRAQPGQRGPPCYPEEPRPMGDPGLGSQEPLPHMAPPVATAAQWEFMQTQARPLTYQQPQGSCISLPSPGQQGSTMFNYRLATSTPILGPQDATNSQPCTSNSMQVHPTPDAQLQQFTQHWIMTPAPSVPHGVISTTATPQLTVLQHPAISSIPAPLHHITTATTAPPVAITNMPAPLYTHAAVSTAPSQQPLLPQHGAFAPGQVVPGHPSPIVNAFPTAVPNQDAPQVLHSINPAASGTLRSYPVPAHVARVPAQTVADQGQPRVCLSGGNSEYSVTSDEDEVDRVDTTPVRDSDSQSGTGTPAVLKAKPLSPEKTAKKVMTLQYLLGELKALVVNQDSAAVQLINEVENSICLLPAMVGSTNIQAELALALQPLRSENVQLRRRLRILNQQLTERERAEREARPVDCDLEMTSLQSLNLTLQLQLRETHKEMEQVQLENKELRQTVEDKESELQLSRQQSETESSRIRIDVCDALSEMRNYQSKLETSMMENTALSSSLQQREADIFRLQEVIRNLQGKLTATSTDYLEVMEAPKSNHQLRKHNLEVHQQEQMSSCGADDVSDSVKIYFHSMEEGNMSSSPPRSHLSPQKTPTSPSAQWRGAGLSPPREKLYPPRCQGVGMGGKESYSVGSERRLGGTEFAPLKESGVARAEANGSPIRMERFVEESGALKSLTAIMDRMAFTARGLPCVDGSRPSNNTGATSHFKVNPGVLPVPSWTSKKLELGGTPAYTGRPSIMESSLSSSNSESQTSDCSMNSWSTFNTRDEEVFRTGLVALDASIARLQRTLEVDLKK